MFRVATAVIGLALVLDAGGASRAQTAETAAGLIEQLPAETEGGKEQESVIRALAARGAGGIRETAALLKAPEEGGDAKARYALHGLAVWHGGPRGEAGRAEFVRAVVELVRETDVAWKRAFLVQQLAWVGSDESVAGLVEFVIDDTLGDPALRVLEAAGKPAEKPLLAALDKGKGEARLAVIQALGRIRAAGAVAALRRLVEEEKGAVRLGALEALGNIGDGSVSGMMLKAAAGEGYEKAKATEAVLVLARRLGEAGKMGEAAEIYREVWKGRAWREETHARLHALRGMAESRGPDAMPDVLEAVASDDVALSVAAKDIAVTAPGAEITRWWIGRAQDGRPSARAAALDILKERGDRAALAVMKSSLSAEVESVRLVAIAGAGRLGGAEAVPWLAGLLGSGDEATRKAAGEALLWIPGEAANDAVAAELEGASDSAREVLLGVLGARGAAAHRPKVLGFVRGGKTAGVRVAAIKAMAVLGAFEDLSVMVEAVLKRDGEEEKNAARDSFITISGRQKDRDSCVRLLREAVPGSGVAARCVILGGLPKLGGDAALEGVRREVAHESIEVREAVVRALAAWPDDKPAPDLLELAKGAGEEKHRVLALRGYVRLAGVNKWRPAEETVKMHRAAMAAAARAEDRKLVLSGLGKVGHITALEMAEEYFEDKETKEEAAAAAVGVVTGMRGTDPAKAEGTLKRVLAMTGSEAVRKKAKDALDYLDKYGDYITAWLVSGPYHEKGLDPEKLLDHAFPPEKEGEKGKGWWRPEQDPESEQPYAIDLNKAIWGENCAGYLKTEVWSPRAQPAVLELGSDDGIKVWLNGVVVHTNNAWRGVVAGDDKADVNLKEGWNNLMLKVSQGGGDWGACARFRAPDGGRLEGLRVKPE